MPLFHDRREAAHELARLLSFLKNEEPIVLGLANGGVPMAEIIAGSLDAPLDVLLIARLGAPKNPEHIVGAVDEHGRISMIRSTARWHHLTSQQMVEPAREVFRQIRRRRGQIRAILPEMDVRGRTVIIVSQGVATGAKMLGAVASVRDRGARRVVAAAPAGSGEAAWQLHEAADVVVIPHRPTKFKSVSRLYDDFIDVSDEAVLAIVERWVSTRPIQHQGVTTRLLKLTNSIGRLLCCEIDLPPGCVRGGGPYPTVIFAHGFESDGRNPRTMPISRRLAERSIIGVRPDFTGHGRSEGDLAEATEAQMTDDLRLVVESVKQIHEVDESRLGLVGSGSGAGAALRVAADQASVQGVVVRSPMEGPEIGLASSVRAPTLLIFAGGDARFSAAHASSGKSLPSHHLALEVTDATRLFSDEISREMMVGASVDWLVDHLATLPFGDGPGRDEGDEEDASDGQGSGGDDGVPESREGPRTAGAGRGHESRARA